MSASVWAVVEDRRLVYQRRLIGKNYIKREIECKLDYYQPEWRATMDVTRWEEEYRYAMNNVSIYFLLLILKYNNIKLYKKKERNKRGQILSSQLLQTYCRSFEQLPPEEQTIVKSILKEHTKKEDIMDAWLQTQDDSLRLYECLGLEDEKQALYEVKL